MRFTVTINQGQCIKFGVSVSEAALMDLLNQLSSWADEKLIGGQTYYFLSRTKVLEELPYFFKKSDTVYRVFKSLEKKKMVEYRTEKRRDFLRLTPYGKGWNRYGKNSEINPSSHQENSETNPDPEMNPRKPGNKSEFAKGPNPLENSAVSDQNSEINPTYKYYKYTRDNSQREMLDLIHKENPFALECVLDNSQFQERLIKYLSSRGHNFDFEKHIGPIIVLWLCKEYTASGLQSTSGNIRTRLTSYVATVLRNGGTDVREIKGILEPKPNYLIDDEG
nr:hypothetical protein [Allomuricauda sp.]